MSEEDKTLLSSHGGEPLALPASALTALLREAIDKGRSFRFQATGFSMSPFIKNGDFVTLSPVNRSGPRLGDVVAFTPPESDKLLLHRVVGKERGSLYMKGDSLPDIDLLLPMDRVLAKVVGAERKGKRIRLGLGPERIIIALLSRWGLLRPLVRLGSGLHS